VRPSRQREQNLWKLRGKSHHDAFWMHLGVHAQVTLVRDQDRHCVIWSHLYWAEFYLIPHGGAMSPFLS
jgi:hypothetical protein